MTIKELAVLNKDGQETTLLFDNGVLQKKIDEGGGGGSTTYKETHYLRRKEKNYKIIISDVLAKQQLENAIAISGTFVVDGEEIIQEGLLGNVFYSSK